MSLVPPVEPGARVDPGTAATTVGGGLGRLATELEARPPACPRDAVALLRGAVLEASDLLPWADFAHSAADSYGRRLVARGACWELMVMSWRGGDYSAIHDHGATQWGAVRYFGRADHVSFVERQGTLSIADRLVTEHGLVLPVSNDLIHLMGNPGAEPFLSLHLYGVPTARDSITGDARVFDLCERHIQRTDGGVFYCLPESQIVRREPCPRADAETRELHHRLMADRIARMDDAGLASDVHARRLRRIAHDLVLGRRTGA